MQLTTSELDGFDLSTFDLVHLLTRFGSGEPEPWLKALSHWRRMLEALEGKCSLVWYSVPNAGKPTAAARRAVAEWDLENSDLLESRVHSIEFVLPDSTSKGAVTAISWIAPPKWEQNYHPNLLSAVEAACRKVGQESGEVSAQFLHHITARSDS